MKNEFIEDIRQKLKGELPGQEAQFKMTHAVRRSYKPAPADARIACVMCLFYEKNDAPHVAFIQRTSKNPNDRHGGQIGFPGGKAEDVDNSHEETALRETEEEIGIKGADIDVLGALTPLYIPVSNFQVYPFVGYLNSEPKFNRQVEEVDAILEIPFSTFLKEENRKEKDMKFSENVILKKVPYFDLGEHTLWGATAMMMSEVVETVTQ